MSDTENGDLEITEKDFAKLPAKQQMVILYKNTKDTKKDYLKSLEMAQQANTKAGRAVLITSGLGTLVLIILGFILSNASAFAHP